MRRRLRYTLVLCVLLGSSGPTLAQTDPHAGHRKPAAAPVLVEPSDATVKKIDKVGGKLTLAHGPLKNLGMPPMTMVFKVVDDKTLARLKEGDRIRFVAEQSGNDYLATRIEKAK